MRREKLLERIEGGIRELANLLGIDSYRLLKVLQSPPIKAAWINRQAGFKPEVVKELLAEIDIEARDLKGCNWIIFSRDRLSTPIFQTGGYYIGELVNSYLPYIWPRVSGNILDVAAAPGGKTFLLSNLDRKKSRLMTIISNEPVRNRRRRLVNNVVKYALDDVRVSGFRGEKLPSQCRFSYIVFDAPCTSLDLLYKRIDDVYGNLKKTGSFSTLQKRILSRIAELLAKEGELIYATCTFTVEETIDVVRHAIDIGLEILDIPNLPFKTVKAEDPWGNYPEINKATYILPTENLDKYSDNIGLAFIARFRGGEGEESDACGLGISYSDEKAVYRYASRAYKDVSQRKRYPNLDVLEMNDKRKVIQLLVNGRLKDVESSGGRFKLIIYRGSPVVIGEQVGNEIWI